MRILLKLVLDCDPDTAWRVIRSPAGLTQVSAPLMEFTSLEDGGFPALWPAGEHPVSVKGLGLVPLGRQVITIGYPPSDQARMVRDTGHGVSGIFPVVTAWEHTMAVSRTANGHTLFRDQLRFQAGAVTLLLWPMYWAFWQWRGMRMRQLASTW